MTEGGICRPSLPARSLTGEGKGKLMAAAQTPVITDTAS